MVDTLCSQAAGLLLEPEAPPPQPPWRSVHHDLDLFLSSMPDGFVAFRSQAAGLLLEPEALPPQPARRSVRKGGAAMHTTQSDESSDFSDS